MSAPQIGSTVRYLDGKGHIKAAIVTGTPETVVEGTSIPVPPQGHVHLLALSISGDLLPRLSVPSLEVAADIDDYKVDGETRRVWLPIV